MTTSILRAASMRRKHSLDIDEIGLELGAKVRRLRGEKGLSRAALAANLEATEERVRKGEAGRSGSFTPHELLGLSRCFDISIDSLFPSQESSDRPNPLKTPEGRELLRLFNEIADPRTRVHLAALFKELAETEEPGPI